MAGAAGDALGYEVEFVSRKFILSRYGEQGVAQWCPCLPWEGCILAL